ncbi:hypothetical protein M569_03085, partial [Genlisea aurea]
MVDTWLTEGDFDVDWSALLNNGSDALDLLSSSDLLVGGFSATPDSDGVLSIDDIEQFLMKDDGFEWSRNIFDGALSPVAALQSPSLSLSDQAKVPSSSPDPDLVEVVTDEEDRVRLPGVNNDEEGSPIAEKKVDDDDVIPDAKKRKRQLRNRDAAVRSRERKKQYVTELEMKSRYYEAECKRLGMMLQYYVAENQALQLSLSQKKAFDAASMPKQESAVLLESLLLGSLLGYMVVGITACLLLPLLLL